MYDSSTIDRAALAAFRAGLSTLPCAADDAERIDRIRLLEELKHAVTAAQAAETAAFVASQRAANLARGVPAARAGRGVAAQIGLARRISPYQAQRYSGWATILTTELPQTFAALRAGQVSEWRAMIVARETAWLSRERRGEVDAVVAPRLQDLGDRRIEAAVKQAAYRLEPRGYVGRMAAAESERRVGVRPAPDVMARLSALLPVAQAIAAHAALRRHADSLIATGDPRGRGQIMADTLVERLTGQAGAAEVPVEIELIMTGASLFGRPESTGAGADEARRAEQDAGVDEPAHLVGYGPVPAAWARDLVLRAPDTAPRWVRRLYRNPATGRLCAADSTRRFFNTAQRRFLRLRDQDICRTPWCDAPIRHIDHVRPVDDGGPTSVDNGQGLCAACNYAKQAPGWTAGRPPGQTDASGRIDVTTPTGHTYSHEPPEPPGGLPPPAFLPDVA